MEHGALASGNSSGVALYCTACNCHRDSPMALPSGAADPVQVCRAILRWPKLHHYVNWLRHVDPSRQSIGTHQHASEPDLLKRF